MKFDAHYALTTLVTSLVLTRLSRQAIPKKCRFGVEYWSSKSVTDAGTCVKCPPHLITCYHQEADDQKRCVGSCKAKPKKTPATRLPSTLPPTPTPQADPSILVIPTTGIGVISEKPRNPITEYKTPEVLTTVVYKTGEHTNEVNADQSSNHGHYHFSQKATIALVVSILAFAGLALFIVWLYVRRQNATGDYRQADSEGQMPLGPTGPTTDNPPVSDSTRTGGIQDTAIQEYEETRFESSLNLPEYTS